MIKFFARVAPVMTALAFGLAFAAVRIAPSLPYEGEFVFSASSLNVETQKLYVYEFNSRRVFRLPAVDISIDEHPA